MIVSQDLHILNMIKLLFRNYSLFSDFRFKLNNYNNEDFATMCGLLREKYQRHNEQIQTSGLIKLLDHSGSVIGVYTASEARKKAEALNLDMVMVSLNTSPITCKAVDFRKRILNRFYDQIVVKSNKLNQARATSTKSIKVSPNLNKNEMIVKIKQIIELSQKYSKIRVFMNVKAAQKQECLSRLEELKSQLLNKCYVEEQISNSRFEEGQEEQQEENKTYSSTNYSFVVRARQQDPAAKQADDKKGPDAAVVAFLRKYYIQEDGEMMDLKSAGLFIVDQGEDFDVPQVKAIETKRPQKEPEDEEMLREAHARILNKRLKVLLSLSL